MCFHNFCNETQVRKGYFHIKHTVSTNKVQFTDAKRTQSLGSAGQASLANINAASPSAYKVRIRQAFKNTGGHTYPMIHLLKNRVATLVEYSFKEDCSNHDGYSESRRSPEEQIVDGLCQRHVGERLRRTGCCSNKRPLQAVERIKILYASDVFCLSQCFCIYLV